MTTLLQEKKQIYVLTPIYATTTSMQGATPVVHYFTREWVKMGHEVTVFHISARFPKAFYWIGKYFQHQLSSRLGMLVPIDSPKDSDYEVEGVTVHHRCFRKMKPHSLYSKGQMLKALEWIAGECEKNGVPDWFVGHWDNPQLELLTALKKRYNRPIALVFHSNDFNIETKYGPKGLEMLKGIDVIGFRSPIGQRRFVEKYGEPKRSFIASSGVSEVFLSAGEKHKRILKQPVRNFVYVGSLIARKYPSAIMEALSQVYPDGNFTMTFIGDGAERSRIEEEHRHRGCIGELRFTGRIPREDIIRYLKESDVFVMISKAEIFGLVYLEAMALGIIPIGSRNEGIDGIIQDGENGFLCSAGNVEELAEILDKIKNMKPEQLTDMSKDAKATAQKYSDEGVAEKYIKALANQ